MRIAQFHASFQRSTYMSIINNCMQLLTNSLSTDWSQQLDPWRSALPSEWSLNPGRTRSQPPVWRIWNFKAYTAASNWTRRLSSWKAWRQPVLTKHTLRENSSSNSSTPAGRPLTKVRETRPFISYVPVLTANFFWLGPKGRVKRTNRFANTKRLS